MANCRHTLCALWLLTPLLFCATGWAADTANQNGETLSIEETVGAVLDGRADGFGVRWNLYVRSHPGARQHVLSLLGNKRARDCRPAALRVLGYVGDDADVEQVDSLIMGSFTGFLDERQVEILKAYCDFLGLMARHGSGTARRKLNEMTTMEYWRHTKFKIRRSSAELGSKPGYEHEHAGLALAFSADALSDDKTLRSRADKVLESIQAPDIREYMRTGKIGAEVLARRVAQVHESETVPVPVEEKVLLNATYRQQAGVLDVTANRLADSDDVLVRESLRDALKEYGSITAQVVSTEKDAVSRIMDNGKPLDMKKAERLRAEYEKDLGREREILGALKGRQIVHQDFEVRQVTAYKFPKLGEQKIGVADKTEEITVTFRLGDSQEVVNANPALTAQRGKSLTVGQDGTLIVLMKKIDGKWYWNPFGW